MCTSLMRLLAAVMLHLHCCCCCLQDAAKTAAEKMGAAADAVTGHAQLPEFPPQEGEGVTTMHPKKAAEVSITPSCAKRRFALKHIQCIT
jgi:hypothetical protein